MSVATWSQFRFYGEDALTYLQGQLTQDVLSPSSPQWTFLLQPDSVVIAAAVLVKDEDGVRLLVPTPLSAPVDARLARFRLRAKVEWTVSESVSPFGSESDRIGAAFPGPHEVAAGLVPHSFGGATVARAVSFSKGCFTGQELVGRLDARGANVPWRLIMIEEGDGALVDRWLKSVGPVGPQGVTSWLVEEGRGLGIAHRTLSLATAPSGVVARFAE